MAAVESSQSAISRLSQIPLVDGTLSYTRSIVDSNAYSASAYAKGQEYADVLYRAIEQKPLAIRMNGYANHTLDWAESRFPVAFQSTPKDLYDGAAGRLKERLTVAKTSIQNLSETLSKTLHSLPGSQQAGDAVNMVHERASAAIHTIVQQFDGVVKLLQSKGHEYSEETRKALKPLTCSLEKHYAQVREKATNKDETLQNRATAVLSYARSEGVPALNETIDAIKSILTHKNEETVDKKNNDSAKGPTATTTATEKKNAESETVGKRSKSKKVNGQDSTISKSTPNGENQ